MHGFAGVPVNAAQSIGAAERVAYWDRLWADMQRGMPQPHHYTTFNAYCRAMDEFTAERNALLEREGREACNS